MLWSLTLVALGAALLTFGGDRLVDASVDLARRARLTPAVIGLTVVAAGTSMPELFVSATAALRGSSEIALGNVVGSNIANIGLILGLCGMVVSLPAGAGVLSFDYPVLLAVSIGVPLLGLDGRLSRPESALCVAALATYLLVSVVRARRRGEAAAAASLPPPVTRGIATLIAMLLAATLALAFGARLLVGGAVQIAETLGVSERIVGLTIVAVGTSLPELVASAAAAIKQQHEMAVSNIVGSNVFNLLGILGVTGVIRPLEFQPEILRLDIPVMLGFTLLLLPILKDTRVSRPEGLLLFLLYASYMVWLARPG